MVLRPQAGAFKRLPQGRKILVWRVDFGWIARPFASHPQKRGKRRRGRAPQKTSRRRRWQRRRNARPRRKRSEGGADGGHEEGTTEERLKGALAGRGRDDRRRHGEGSGWRPGRCGEVQRAAEDRPEDQRPRSEPGRSSGGGMSARSEQRERKQTACRSGRLLPDGVGSRFGDSATTHEHAKRLG